MATKKPLKSEAGCKCIDMLNEQLRPSNVEVDTKLCMDFTNMKASTSGASILLRKIDDKKRTKMPTVMCSYCPVCGTKVY